MKLIALTTVVTLLTLTAYTQNKTTFGVRAGLNIQNFTWDDIDGETVDTKLKAGFHLGVNAEIPIAPEFYVQPGILFSTKGAKEDFSDAKINLSYIEIPINFLYKPELGDGKLLVGAGPYIAFGVGGKVKNGSDIDIEFEKEISLQQYQAGEKYYLKRLDVGGNLLFGYEFTNNFSVQLNAQLGLVNIHPDVKDAAGNNAKIKNVGFGVSAGYRF